MSEGKRCPKCGYERTSEDAQITPATECPSCGVIYAKLTNPSMGRSQRTARANAPHRLAPFTMLNLGLAMAGAALLALGAFLPAFSLGAISVTYFKGGDGDGVFVVIAAAIIFLGAIAKKRRIVGYAGIASLALVLFGMFTLSSRLSEGKADLARELDGNPFAGLAMSISESASMEWGWAVMLLGAILAIFGGFVSERWLKDRYG